jgi:predicted O-methyltransferase YrrM
MSDSTVVGSEDDTTRMIAELYQAIIGREPRQGELAMAQRLCGTGAERQLILKLLDSPEHKARVRVPSPFPNGHFYSPVVDPSEVERYWETSSAHRWNEISGVALDLPAMERFWRTNLEMARSAPFTQRPGETTRYHWGEGPYPRGDAVVLLVMIGTARPRRIIEIGSGFSSAAMLDAAEHFALTELQLTCIDPNAARLRRLLRPQDEQRVEVLEQQVQNVPLERFRELGANDILFIDSSHVLKTGSDLHYELFSILPTLNEGVLVHFHDIFDSFEYPREWIVKKRRSWNEVYALHAFLAFNRAFEVVFFTNMFAKERPELFQSGFGEAGRVSGGSIWLRRRAAG